MNSNPTTEIIYAYYGEIYALETNKNLGSFDGSFCTINSKYAEAYRVVLEHVIEIVAERMNVNKSVIRLQMTQVIAIGPEK